MCANHACLTMVAIGIIYIHWDNKTYVRTLGTLPHESKVKKWGIFRSFFRIKQKCAFGCTYWDNNYTKIELNIIASWIRSLRKILTNFKRYEVGSYATTIQKKTEPSFKEKPKVFLWNKMKMYPYMWEFIVQFEGGYFKPASSEEFLEN